MLLDENEQPRAAFEAKWWNSSAGDALLLNDVAKLRRMCPKLEKYLLTFWWGTDQTKEKDLADAQKFCTTNHLELWFVDTFETKLRGLSNGYFALGIIWVPQVAHLQKP
ncbi:MAG TPA: hypothetical protein PK156_32430 [Polyangium sp.]|nr:hypothetical protein [Polyangium sp.]